MFCRHPPTTAPIPVCTWVCAIHDNLLKTWHTRFSMLLLPRIYGVDFCVKGDENVQQYGDVVYGGKDYLKVT